MREEACAYLVMLFSTSAVWRMNHCSSPDSCSTCARLMPTRLTLTYWRSGTTMTEAANRNTADSRSRRKPNHRAVPMKQNHQLPLSSCLRRNALWYRSCE
jgi:hypothetical protein